MVTYAPRLINAPGTVVSPHASHAPMFWRLIPGAVQVKPSPCHANVPTVAGVVENDVDKYVDEDALDVSTMDNISVNVHEL